MCSRQSAPSLLGELAEDLGARIVRRANLPPVSSAFDLARACGYHVVPYDLGGCFEGFNVYGTTTLYISPHVYEPRTNFTLLHELAEAMRPSWIPLEWKEKFCDRVAAAALMPRNEFIRSVVACRWDLAALRRHWTFCSYEAIAGRLTDIMPGVTMSSWKDADRRYRRGEAAPELEIAESVALAEAYAGRGMAVVRSGSSAACAWRLGGIATKHAITLTLAA